MSVNRTCAGRSFGTSATETAREIAGGRCVVQEANHRCETLPLSCIDARLPGRLIDRLMHLFVYTGNPVPTDSRQTPRPMARPPARRSQVALNIVTLGLLLCLGAAFLASCSGTQKKKDDAVETDGDEDADEQTELEKLLAVGDPEVGNELFLLKCAPCHGTIDRPAGRSAPWLFDAAWTKKAWREQARATIVDGRDEMPAFGNRIPSRQIDDLLTYFVAESRRERETER